MRLTVRTEGGFAHLPGLSRPVSFDTEDLPEGEARRIEALLGESCFFELPGEIPAREPAHGAVRDARAVAITAREGGREHTVVCREPLGENPAGSDEALRGLVSLASRLALDPAPFASAPCRSAEVSRAPRRSTGSGSERRASGGAGIRPLPDDARRRQGRATPGCPTGNASPALLRPTPPRAPRS